MYSGRLSSDALEIENSPEHVRITGSQIQLAAGTNLRLEVLGEIPDDLSLCQKWNALALSVDQPQVFYTFEWALAVARAYRASLRPLLFLAYDTTDSLCGVAALATDASGKGVSFLCATTGDYCDFLSPPQIRNTFVRAVLNELKERGVNETVLTNLPADSPTLAAIEANAPSYQLFNFARPAYLCAQVSLPRLQRRGQSDPVLPRKKMLRRFLNAMGREYPVQLEHGRSWNEIEPLLPDFMRSHVARFLVLGRISNLARAERRAFIAELSRLLSKPGWLALTRMTSGDRVLAWNYGFQFQSTWFWYQPTFDMKLEKYSPGFCLLAKMVEEAAADPVVHTVDLGLGAEEYKDRFANQVRPTVWVSVTPSRARHFSTILRYRISEIVKKNRSVEKIARSLLESGSRFRRRLRESGLIETFLWSCRRALRTVAGREEVLFYELPQPDLKAPLSNELSLAPMDLNLLASAAMQYSDEETLSYLVRSAQRLNSSHSCSGFALIDSDQRLVHFTWVRPFEGFHLSELHGSVISPSPESVIVFDAWTPPSLRGLGHYAEALALVVASIRREGKRAWIFSASRNASSIRGLQKAGLRPSFSVFRYWFLGWQKIVQRQADSHSI